MVALLVPRLAAHDIILDCRLLHPRALHGVAHAAPDAHAGAGGDGEVAGDGLEQCACRNNVNLNRKAVQMLGVRVRTLVGPHRALEHPQLAWLCAPFVQQSVVGANGKVVDLDQAVGLGHGAAVCCALAVEEGADARVGGGCGAVGAHGVGEDDEGEAEGVEEGKGGEGKGCGQVQAGGGGVVAEDGDGHDGGAGEHDGEVEGFVPEGEGGI